MWYPFKKKKRECNCIVTPRIQRFVIPVGKVSKNIKTENKDYYLPEDNLTEEQWKELTTQEKLDRGKLDEKWVDWNQYDLDTLSDYLEKRYQFSSSGEALAIIKLIDFYRNNK